MNTPPAQATDSTEPVAEIVECEKLGQQTVREIDGRWKFLPYGTKLYAAEAVPPASSAPIDMVLHCPSCGEQHVDAPEQADADVDVDGSVISSSAAWDNPPHRSHLCHACGHIWRPADVPTNGVLAVKTVGKNDRRASNAAEPAGGTCKFQPCESKFNDACMLACRATPPQAPAVPASQQQAIDSIWARVQLYAKEHAASIDPSCTYAAIEGAKRRKLQQEVLLRQAVRDLAAVPAGLSDAQIQAIWDEACNDTPQKPGWCRHIRYARAIIAALAASAPGAELGKDQQ